MPVTLPSDLKRLDDALYSRLVYEAMGVVFDVHSEFGRLFEEQVYAAEVARRLGCCRTEVMFQISFDSFRKPYYLDLLFRDGAVFELKCASKVVQRHRAQLLNYLYILEMPHGKLVNLRADSVQHEFVNAPLRRADRTSFLVDVSQFKKTDGISAQLPDLILPLLRDWGTCLETSLYEEAIMHFLGGEAAVVRPIEIFSGPQKVAVQSFKLLTPFAAFKVTGFNGEQPRYETELAQLLAHTKLRQIQWINVGTKTVTFKTLQNRSAAF